ncbi:2-phosphoxylose phosphatase 1 [Teleopsis dalmanni]|uniref:2-phosphoxylose phosphatase 1 n=1 Tax=Teleopsis dalmanni TaxID=139649 RepID=UPI0018CF6FC9|nr:2-phosphoxylose phosphatase 1 [Teleopsis dalmanni]
MLLKELIRFSTQHRTLYCYMILSIWIFLLIAGMYKYIGHNSSSLSSTLSFLNGKTHAYAPSAAGEVDNEEVLKYRKFKERCTPLEQLVRRDDGGILEGWKLQGVLLVIRHGDRGPMSHVRGVANIDCGVVADALVNRYRSFLYNSTSTSGANHMYWNKVGPFHGFAMLPPTDKSCFLGQLTYKGIAQLLHVGELLHQIYAHPLGLLLKQMTNKSTMSSTPHSLLNSDEVVVYTTRYRRTFQSALALLFTFLPVDKWLALNIRESHSMAFCFTDCACAQAEVLRRRMSAISARQLSQHPVVAGVMQWIGTTLLQHTPNGINDPNEVVDAMLTILCHDVELPCRHSTATNSTRTPTTPTSTLDLSDVINIDQDDTAANLMDVNAAQSAVAPLEETQTGVNSLSVTEGCIEHTHVSALMFYANWQSGREAKHVYYKRIGLMRAYGMIRHIVSYMLKMISGDRTKFVLYSGHDWTLQYLTAALGIQTENTFIPYAARLSIELYKSEAHTDYYFRVLYNGRDVTNEIDFCEGGKSLRITRDSRGNKADLCPIENIIRFLHDDYFGPLNATNFKDACTVTPKSNDF